MILSASGVERLDLTILLGGGNRPSRISFRDDQRQKEPRDPPAQETSTLGALVDRPEDGDDLTSEGFLVLDIATDVEIIVPLSFRGGSW